MTRLDGRESTSLRPLSCEVSCLQSPDGSCKLKSGNTEVLVAVYGPVAPRGINKEDPNEACIAVVFKNSTGNEREMERFIGEAVSGCILKEEFPRCVIEIVVQVIQSDGTLSLFHNHKMYAKYIE